MDVSSDVVIRLMQQLYPDQFARCIAEAKAIKLEEMLKEAQDNQENQAQNID